MKDRATQIELLVRQLRSCGPRTRRKAARALGKSDDTEAVEALLGAIADPNENVRAEIVRALGELEDARAIDALCAVVSAEEEDFIVRRAALFAFGHFGSRGVDPLAAILREPRSGVALRDEAAWALGITGSEKAGPALVAALGDSSRRVRRSAADALIAIGIPIRPLVVGGAETPSRTVRRACRRILRRI